MDNLAKQLPEVKGYRILCAVPEVEDAYESGILKADGAKKLKNILLLFCLLCPWVI